MFIRFIIGGNRINSAGSCALTEGKWRSRTDCFQVWLIAVSCRHQQLIITRPVPTSSPSGRLHASHRHVLAIESAETAAATTDTNECHWLVSMKMSWLYRRHLRRTQLCIQNSNDVQEKQEVYLQRHIHKYLVGLDLAVSNCNCK